MAGAKGMTDKGSASPHDIFDRRLVLAGEHIFAQGDAGHVMYYLHSGMVRIWQGSPAQPKVLGVVTDGGVFGEMALVDGQPRMANATAQEDSLVYFIPATVLHQKLDNADPFLRGLIRILVSNLRSTSVS